MNGRRSHCVDNFGETVHAPSTIPQERVFQLAIDIEQTVAVPQSDDSVLSRSGCGHAYTWRTRGEHTWPQSQHEMAALQAFQESDLDGPDVGKLCASHFDIDWLCVGSAMYAGGLVAHIDMLVAINYYYIHTLVEGASYYGSGGAFPELANADID